MAPRCGYNCTAQLYWHVLPEHTEEGTMSPRNKKFGIEIHVHGRLWSASSIPVKTVKHTYNGELSFRLTGVFTYKKNSLCMSVTYCTAHPPCTNVTYEYVKV
jgi:hypothetical protein